MNIIKSKRVKDFPFHLWLRPISDSPLPFHLTVLALCALLSGCGAGRTTYHEGKRADIHLSDTLIRQHLYQGLQNKNVTIRQVSLSPPDTLKRQYVQRIVELQSVEEHRYEGKDSVTGKRSLQADITEQKERDRVRGISGWLYGGLLFLIAGSGLYMVCNRKY